jgi:tRNA-dihydrouridine synthase B
MKQNNLKIYQSPLQGYTSFEFRLNLAECFGGIDKYFIPYLSYGKGHEIKKSQLREILPENNDSLNVVPQVLFSDTEELIALVKILIDHGYTEINLNLGCPYPMATNKGRGAAWLGRPKQLNETITQLYEKQFPAKFSVKMRAGMNTNREDLAIFETLNQFPLEEIIFHPRTATQMYNDKAEPGLFTEAIPLTNHRLVYNGDIVSTEIFSEIQQFIPDQEFWMIGRGLLMNPALALQLKDQDLDKNAIREKLHVFHDKLLEAYSARLEGSGHILMKMNMLWEYLSQSFENPHKVMKLVKKSGTLVKYHAAIAEIFQSY